MDVVTVSIKLHRLTLRLSSSYGKSHLPSLSCVAHHTNHHMVAGSKYRLSIYSNNLITREQPPIEVSSSSRYYVANGHLKWNITTPAHLCVLELFNVFGVDNVLASPSPEILPLSPPLFGTQTLNHVGGE